VSSIVSFRTDRPLNSACQGSSILSSGKFIQFAPVDATAHTELRFVGVSTDYEIFDGLQSKSIDMVASTTIQKWAMNALIYL
jgi:hypothetical protein